MSKNEIFNNYAKIALEKGLIKNADKKTNKEIENLYNVKIDRPSEMDYKKNIVETAHPEPVVLFQSHDKINSLVENVNERQDIIVNILRKMPNGNLAQRKYARDLALSLIRIATDMDNQNNDELRVLADTCAEQLQKKAFDFKDFISERGEDVKDVGTGAAVGALAGALIGVFGGPVGIGAGAAAGAALGVAISAIFKTSPQAKNLVINAEIARNELTDLIKDFPTEAVLQELDTALLHITTTASNYSQLVDQLRSPSAQVDKATVQKVATSYLEEIAKLNVLIGRFLSDAKRGQYAEKESDWWAKVKTPFTALMGNDVDDEVKALETLSRILKETQSGITSAMREARDLHKEVGSESKTNSVSQKASPKENHEASMQEQLTDLDKQFQNLNFKP